MVELQRRRGGDGIYRFTAPPGSALMWAQSRARLQREGLGCPFSSSLPSLKFCCIENFIYISVQSGNVVEERRVVGGECPQ